MKEFYAEQYFVIALSGNFDNRILILYHILRQCLHLKEITALWSILNKQSVP